MIRKDAQPAFGKTDDIQRCGKGLRHIKGDAHAAPRLQAERLGNDRVSAAGADLDVGGDRSHGQAGEEGNRFRQEDDHHRSQQAGVADHPAQAEVHDHAENGQDRR